MNFAEFGRALKCETNKINKCVLIKKTQHVKTGENNEFVTCVNEDNVKKVLCLNLIVKGF